MSTHVLTCTTYYICTLLTLLPRHQRLTTPHNAHLSLSSSAPAPASASASSSASHSKLLRPRLADPPCSRVNHRCPHPFFSIPSPYTCFVSLPTHGHNHAPKKSPVFTLAPHVIGVRRRSWVCACVMCVHVRVKGKKDLTGFFRTTVTGTCA
ncbi:hypothetical protein COCMIDRAFT_33504 [Bipolaris oryzae ATCC 44560]|uniref:Uncharacterized protein n=1 Tax=Bipolaris oryzae ATCC 44560 TaxID=930090 RepID=W6ZNE9_COCMI|nr:uncharacterized protein COCMIDRAFT_33504 [Bipolaris oryzae ATCC 44560]EUC49029.1 hypothetical protein COCMIDRAFT_33504 [Bipolaris oryzae ATCC 44560]